MQLVEYVPVTRGQPGRSWELQNCGDDVGEKWGRSGEEVRGEAKGVLSSVGRRAQGSAGGNSEIRGIHV